MDSSMIGKIVKAKRYAEQRDRISFSRFRVALRGVHADHVVEYQEGQWHCDCDFFGQRGVCSHTMAMERVLEEMVVPAQQKVPELQPVA
jgi:hypothetical protein